MKPAELLEMRLKNQALARARFKKPEEVVAWFGAVQAQDYLGSLWAVGQRMRAGTESGVEAAEARRAIVRTWPLRGTLHFVAAEDARWMIRLLAPRVIAKNAARWKREVGVDAKLIARAGDVVAAALEGGRRLAREQVYEVLEARRIRTNKSRGLHLLLCLALQGRLCLAGRLGKQHSFALLDEWIPKSRNLEGDAALSELALRYFTSHGPATLKDFIWWAGITVRQATIALDGARTHLTAKNVEGVHYWWREAAGRREPADAPLVRLLPAFDEFTVAYQDRSLLVDGAARVTKMGLLNPAVLVDGRVVGTWKRELEKRSAAIDTRLTRKLNRAESAALNDAVQRYGEFLGCDARLTR